MSSHERERGLREFQRLVDDRIEEVQRDRLGLAVLMERVLPLLRDQLRASTAFVRTLAEDLHETNYQCAVDADGAALPESVFADVENSVRDNSPFDTTGPGEAAAGYRVVAQHLDVAGDFFGAVGVGWAEGDERSVDEVHPWLDAFAEELDNHLAAVRLSRIKQSVLVAIGQALKDPLLGRGIEKAVRALRAEIEFDHLFLSYRHEDRYADEHIYHKVFDGSKLVYDSERGGDATVSESAVPDPVLREAVSVWIAGEQSKATDQLTAKARLQETIIYGMREEVQLGRILLVSATQDVSSTFNRDLMELFSNAICQRILDYSKESSFLHQFFSAAHTDRMLAEDGYRAKYLTPQSAKVAILYTDISGFTRLSEQHLKDPELIGLFVDLWSRRAVEILWSHGGVFDKLVGDCIIGIFGPPFYELSELQMCERAARTAIELGEFTRNMASGPLGEQFPQLKEIQSALGVATGLNLARANVGTFGPNNDFTAFSSGMNNTARLQGLATKDEIMVMEQMTDLVREAGYELGDVQEAEVKNVAEPLRYRLLLG